MFSCGFIPRRRMLVAAIVMYAVCTDALAAFGGFMPLSWSGQLAYDYAYMDSGGSESESTALLLSLNATGYVWQPWFASTSMAFNVGLSNTETSTSSSDGVVGTGSFSLGVFPSSRFPFSVNYSRTDSRSQLFQDVSRTGGETLFKVTRLSMRQTYRPRLYSQLYNAWYYSTEYEGGAFNSESMSYGLDYTLRVSPHSLSINATHSESTSGSNSSVPSVDVSTLTHVYTPSSELGVTNLLSIVQVDPDDVGPISTDSQATSSFYWRPEHRAVNVSGGVRLSDSRSEGSVSAVSRSLNTSLGLGYRLTRSLNLSASASLGTTDNNSVQTLSTTQGLRVSYTGARRRIAGFSYAWQWSGGMSNANTRTESASVTGSSGQQNYSSSIGHNLSKSWNVGQGGSVNGTFSQSASGNKSSKLDVVSKTLNHGLGLSWNRRGRRGSTYVSGRLSDSRGYGEKDTVFSGFGANLVSDYTINRLSSLAGNMDFSASQNESENEAGGKDTSGARTLSGGLSYRNDRPLGIYNLRFTTSLTGSKKVDSADPTATLRWDSTFHYSLGLLSTTLGLRVSENPGGAVSKSMNFQATRSF